MNAVTVENLCKSYGGKTVLRGVSFYADSGSALCLTAPSGAGKTTLLRILMGLEVPDSGTILFSQNCRWAAVFQEDRLLEHRNAVGNLRFALGKYDTGEAAALLEELGLGDVGKKPVREYSGGMKRRLALARALLAESGALALDEPFTGLDRETRRHCLEAVRRRTDGKLVFIATHDSADAAALGARILRLSPPDRTE